MDDILTMIVKCTHDKITKVVKCMQTDDACEMYDILTMIVKYMTE